MSTVEKVSQYLADNLVTLRTKKGLSQQQLAELAEIPRSTLTNIESGSGNPSLQNLARISTALQISIEELLSRPRNECQLILAEDVASESRSQGKVRIYKLIPDKVKGLDVDRMELDGGATMGGHPHLAGAKEYFSVIQGEVTVAVAGEKFVVRKGDVLAFPGDQSHSYRNTGSQRAIAVSMIIPVTLNH
jgi:transcriptional regulator with XRE-family HTH domain